MRHVWCADSHTEPGAEADRHTEPGAETDSYTEPGDEAGCRAVYIGRPAVPPPPPATYEWWRLAAAADTGPFDVAAPWRMPRLGVIGQASKTASDTNGRLMDTVGEQRNSLYRLSPQAEIRFYIKSAPNRSQTSLHITTDVFNLQDESSRG